MHPSRAAGSARASAKWQQHGGTATLIRTAKEIQSEVIGGAKAGSELSAGKWSDWSLRAKWQEA